MTDVIFVGSLAVCSQCGAAPFGQMTFDLLANGIGHSSCGHDTFLNIVNFIVCVEESGFYILFPSKWIIVYLLNVVIG